MDPPYCRLEHMYYSDQQYSRIPEHEPGEKGENTE